MCSCMPAFKPFLARILPKLNVSRSYLPRFSVSKSPRVSRSARRGTRLRSPEAPEHTDDGVILEMRTSEQRDKKNYQKGHISPNGFYPDGGIRIEVGVWRRTIYLLSQVRIILFVKYNHPLQKHCFTLKSKEIPTYTALGHSKATLKLSPSMSTNSERILSRLEARNFELLSNMWDCSRIGSCICFLQRTWVLYMYRLDNEYIVR